jgi:hypothetical protein
MTSLSNGSKKTATTVVSWKSKASNPEALDLTKLVSILALYLRRIIEPSTDCPFGLGIVL